MDQSAVSVEGTKIDIKENESVLYWSPAPPKWYVAPTKVKEKLFPEYSGAVMLDDLGTKSSNSDVDSDTDSAEFEHRLARER